MKEIEAFELLPVILDLATAVRRLQEASALLALDRKAEVKPVLIQIGKDLENIASAMQQFVDRLRADDAV
jgi:hypothetical protein